MSRGAFTLRGDSRAMMVQDHRTSGWSSHKYLRFDLQASPVGITLDLSKVPCGCLACVYFVAAKDPSDGKSQYCGAYTTPHEHQSHPML